jgi:hypothetical protein
MRIGGKVFSDGSGFLIFPTLHDLHPHRPRSSTLTHIDEGAGIKHEKCRRRLTTGSLTLDKKPERLLATEERPFALGYWQTKVSQETLKTDL